MVMFKVRFDFWMRLEHECWVVPKYVVDEHKSGG